MDWIVDRKAMNLMQQMMSNNLSLKDIMENGMLEQALTEMADDTIRRELGYSVPEGSKFLMQQTMNKARKMINDDIQDVLDLTGKVRVERK